MSLPPFLFPRPNFGLLGHRGVAGLAPENTIHGFKMAADLGLNWIEFDARLTKDDHWIIMHDDSLERTTNGQGRISDLTLEQIKSFEAGLWFHPPKQNISVPTLLETLECAHETGLNVNIEIKGAADDRQRYVDQFVYFLNHHYAAPFARPLISSFDLEFLIAFRQAMPEFRIGYLVGEFSKDTVEIALEHSFTTIHCDIKTITEQNLNQAFSHHLPVLLYTGNDQKVANHWLTKGVAGIFTDRPDVLHSGVQQTLQSLQQALT